MSNLDELVKLREKEICDVKNSVADVLQKIRDLVQDINQDNIDIKKREISELCTNTRYELLVDENTKIKEPSFNTNHDT